MPPRQRNSAAGSELAGGRSAREFAATIWAAMAEVRGSFEVMRDKEVLLGLLLLKHLSDRFDGLRTRVVEEALAEGAEPARLDDLLNDSATYADADTLWIPEVARWSSFSARARTQPVGPLLQEAMEAVKRENPSMAAALPAPFLARNTDHRGLPSVMDAIDQICSHDPADGSQPDVLPELFEQFLARFARAQGKRGSDFHTPQSVARLMAKVIEPRRGTVYDPACGAGSMLVEAGRFVTSRGGRSTDLTFYGQEFNAESWRLAKMNLAVHDLRADLADTHRDTLADDRHPGLKADFILAHPPVNVHDWVRDETDHRWTYGVPPRNNANYAWLQHAISKMSDHGTAGVVLPSGSRSSSEEAEGRIRRALIEADLVAAMVALPAGLFPSTSIPTCLWVLSKDKSPRRSAPSEDRRRQILFIDAHRLGREADQATIELSEEDITTIASTYHVWRDLASAQRYGRPYQDQPGFCFSADLDTVRDYNYALTPGHYVDLVPPHPENPKADAARGARLTHDLYGLFP